MENKNVNLYEVLTNKMISILEDLKKDPERWERPWILSENGLGGHNAQSKHKYAGINQIFLSYECQSKNYQFNRWLSFKQISDLGGKVKKGEKSTQVIFCKILKYEKEGQPTDTGTTENEISKRFFLKYYNVFNVAQAENLPEKFTTPYTKEELKEIDTVELGEQILKRSGANIYYLQQDQAYFSPLENKICLPLRNQFKSSDLFYGTAFHELTHWTGHADRLNRKLFNCFGSEDYAREELTAEMGSVFLCNSIGIDRLMKHSASYIDSWLQALKKDKTALVKSTMQAQTAADYLLKAADLMFLKDGEEETEDKKAA